MTRALLIALACAVLLSACGASTSTTPTKTASGPSRATLAEAVLASGISQADAHALADVWYSGRTNNTDAAEAVALLTRSWDRFQLLDADAIERDFYYLSDGYGSAERARLADQVVAYARRQEAAGRLPRGGTRTITSRLRLDEVIE